MAPARTRQRTLKNIRFLSMFNLYHHPFEELPRSMQVCTTPANGCYQRRSCISIPKPLVCLITHSLFLFRINSEDVALQPVNFIPVGEVFA